MRALSYSTSCAPASQAPKCDLHATATPADAYPLSVTSASRNFVFHFALLAAAIPSTHLWLVASRVSCIPTTSACVLRKKSSAPLPLPCVSSTPHAFALTVSKSHQPLLLPAASCSSSSITLLVHTSGTPPSLLPSSLHPASPSVSELAGVDPCDPSSSCSSALPSPSSTTTAARSPAPQSCPLPSISPPSNVRFPATHAAAFLRLRGFFFRFCLPSPSFPPFTLPPTASSQLSSRTKHKGILPFFPLVPSSIPALSSR